MQIKIVVNNDLPVLFRNLGLIFLHTDRMLDIQVIPGDFVVCKDTNNSKEYFFKVALPISNLFEKTPCDALIEPLYELEGNVEIQKIDENNLNTLRQIFIESSSQEKIQDKIQEKLKNYLIERKIPVNNNGCVVFSSQVYFFKNIEISGLVSDSTVVWCIQSRLDKELEDLQLKNRNLKRQISEVQKGLGGFEKLQLEKFKELEKDLQDMNAQNTEKHQIIGDKQKKIEKLTIEIHQLRQRLDYQRREEQRKKFDNEQLLGILKASKKS